MFSGALINYNFPQDFLWDVINFNFPWNYFRLLKTIISLMICLNWVHSILIRALRRRIYKYISEIFHRVLRISFQSKNIGFLFFARVFMSFQTNIVKGLIYFNQDGFIQFEVRQTRVRPFTSEVYQVRVRGYHPTPQILKSFILTMF